MTIHFFHEYNVDNVIVTSESGDVGEEEGRVSGLSAFLPLFDAVNQLQIPERDNGLCGRDLMRRFTVRWMC